jgi:cytochrome c biogenesis protein CcmG/thiol:disulfide interchange protein DsbE
MSMLSTRQWNILLAAVLIAGSAFIAATRAQPGIPAIGSPAPLASGEPAPEVGRPAPDFTLSDTSGATVSLAGLRGKVVLVNIWATWCPPCRAEMPAIQASYQRYQAAGFTVLAVNLGEDAATVAAFLDQQRLTFPTLLDPQMSVGAAYRTSAIPGSFFIDRNGTVRAVYRGPLPHGVIDATVAGLVAEEH